MGKGREEKEESHHLPQDPLQEEEVGEDPGQPESTPCPLETRRLQSHQGASVPAQEEAPEVATAEVAATEVAATEVAATEVATAEVAATEVAATEVATTEVATRRMT
jgi:hypothetical protein